MVVKVGTCEVGRCDCADIWYWRWFLIRWASKSYASYLLRPFIMFTIRRLQTQSVRLASTTATVQAASSTVPADAPVKKGRIRPLKTRRPNISLEHPREWKRPLAYGVLPAYDEALKFIKADSEELKLEMQDVQASLKAAKHAPTPDPLAIKQIEERLDYLEIQSEINFPQVQWKCANGMGAWTIFSHYILCGLIAQHSGHVKSGRQAHY